MKLSKFISALLIILIALPANAASILRDPDIEHALQKLAAPVLQAAGLSSTRTKILVINDPKMNAFVVDANHIFIHSGLLLKMEDAAMLQSVIAHEAAHIANGHLARRAVNAQNARTAAGLGFILSAVAAASGGGAAAAAAGIGATNSAARVFMKHTRAEEASADASGLRYMSRAGLDPSGFKKVMDLFRGQELISEHRQDPYARTHPMSRDRLRAIEAFLAGNGKSVKPNPESDYWFARAKGKLSAFLRAPKWTLRRANGKTDIDVMRRAIAYHRQPNKKKAISTISSLANSKTNDPYVHELRGQILLESREYPAAVQAYRRAVQLAPRNGLILAGYGRSLLVSGQPKAALKPLEQARSIDFRNPGVLRDLAQAYAKTGNNGMASLVTAERYALVGRPKDAQIHAKRASGLLSRGSGAWIRAQDVLSATKAARK